MVVGAELDRPQNAEGIPIGRIDKVQNKALPQLWETAEEGKKAAP
jgi:hypothetical protein